MRMRILPEIIAVFKNMSILRKFTIAYIVTIFIPTMVMGYHNYIFFRKEMLQKFLEANELTLTQIKENIVSKIDAVENVGGRIAYDYQIQSFLYSKFEMDARSLDLYLYRIDPIVTNLVNSKQVNVYRISIYTNNYSIPEHWTSFYHDTYLKDKGWYTDFIGADDKQEMWLGIHNASLFKTVLTRYEPQVFSLVRKIRFPQGKYVGIVVVDILKDEMFAAVSNIHKKDADVYVLDKDFQIVSLPSGSSQPMDDLGLIRANIKGEKGYFRNKSFMYLYDAIAPLNMYLLYKVPIGSIIQSSANFSISFIFSIFIGMLGLELFTYLLLRMIFAKLRKMVGIVDHASKGNLDVRIAVDSNDEIGQLANDFNILIQKMDMLIKDVVRKQIAYKDAQLSALQYQINPHFIYNTLDIFRMKAELKGEYELAQAITDFGKILRYNISNEAIYVKLNEEIMYTQKYINLLKLRYGDNIKLHVDIPDNIGDIDILRFIIQPIVENSVKHGWDIYENKLNIFLHTEAIGEDLMIYIEDDGKGIDQKQLDDLNYQLMHVDCEIYDEFSKNEGIGLININKRLKLFYGEHYYLKLESVLGEKTRTIIKIPLRS